MVVGLLGGLAASFSGAVGMAQETQGTDLGGAHDPGPPPPPKPNAGSDTRPHWRRAFHESYSHLFLTSIDVDPKIPGGVSMDRNDRALMLTAGGVKVWRPRDWKVLPWMEVGLDFGTTQFSSDPPEGGEPIRFMGIAGFFGTDIRIVPWNDQKLNLAAGPLIGGHLHGFTEQDAASYGWDLGGRVRGLWEKSAGETPKLVGELRFYRRHDKDSSGTYGEISGGFGFANVVLFALYRSRLSATTPDDPEVELGDRMPFASFLGAGIRIYSERE